jgi:hypothetical protein
MGKVRGQRKFDGKSKEGGKNGRGKDFNCGRREHRRPGH